MNKDILSFNDRVSIISPKTLQSEIFLKDELNLIEYKTVIQSDDFSYKNNLIKIDSPIEFNHLSKLFINDIHLELKQIKSTLNSSDEHVLLSDKIINNFTENMNYKIIQPSKNSSFHSGENIYFECGIITNDSLKKENFDSLIWMSSLDGLIGNNNCFNTMLTVGEHIISLIMIDNQSQIIKDEVKITVSQKSINLPELNKQ